MAFEEVDNATLKAENPPPPGTSPWQRDRRSRPGGLRDSKACALVYQFMWSVPNALEVRNRTTILGSGVQRADWTRQPIGNRG